MIGGTVIMINIKLLSNVLQCQGHDIVGSRGVVGSSSEMLKALYLHFRQGLEEGNSITQLAK